MQFYESRRCLLPQVKKTVAMSQEHNFEPLVVLEFGPKTTQAAQEWLTAKLQAPRAELGAELQVRTNYMDSNEVGDHKFTQIFHHILC